MALIQTDQTLAGIDKRPSDLGLLTWTYPPSQTAASTAVGTAGTLQLQRVHLPFAATVTSIVSYIGTAAVGGTAGQNFMGLWTAAGALVGVTADQTGAWGSASQKNAALAGGPYLLSAGDLYIGYWWNAATSGPGFAKGNVIASAVLNGLLSSSFVSCTADTGLTTTGPSTLGATTASSHNWWAGLA